MYIHFACLLHNLYIQYMKMREIHVHTCTCNFKIAIFLITFENSQNFAKVQSTVYPLGLHTIPTLEGLVCNYKVKVSVKGEEC